MRRVAVYAGTRNIYNNMVVAARSLLWHTRMDRVVFLIEDDTFQEPLPSVIETMNVSGQEFFPQDGPNYQSRWTYMTLMRLVLPETVETADLSALQGCSSLMNVVFLGDYPVLEGAVPGSLPGAPIPYVSIRHPAPSRICSRCSSSLLTMPTRH